MMTVAEWCIFAVVALYLLTIVSVKWSGARQYDVGFRAFAKYPVDGR